MVDQGWVVKGATALLAREIGVRGTKDIDVYRDAALEVAEADLRQAVEADIGDWFRFELGPAQPMGDDDKGLRVPVTAYIGPTVWVTLTEADGSLRQDCGAVNTTISPRCGARKS